MRKIYLVVFCCLLSHLNILELERESNEKIFAGKIFDNEAKLDIITRFRQLCREKKPKFPVKSRNSGF